jgi:DNA repair exonuclease SbcCD ATPase subunit
MITFKTLTYSNFLSTGTKSTTILLNKSPSTLIIGQNGSGKSTILDALSFALFGKAHRSITKGQLINSINNKNCVVTVEFSIGKHEFKIVRGIKPNIFEIWQNDVMINQSSAAKDYQKYLEQNILKLNHKSFHQIVVLGSSSFIPFMKLSTNHRREVIEDLLDIQVFSKMNQILKEKDGKIKEHLFNATHHTDRLKEKIVSQKKYIKDIAEISDDQINSKKKDIDKTLETIVSYRTDNETHHTFISENAHNIQSELSEITKKKQSLTNFMGQFNTQIAQVVKESKFYSENDTCPTCSQDIDSILKDVKLDKAKTRAVQLNEGISKIIDEEVTIDSLIKDLTTQSNSIINKQSVIDSNNKSINLLLNNIKSYEKDINSITEKSGDLSESNAELVSLINQLDVNSNEKSRLTDERVYNSVAAEMLKDTGIKTKVIKQYLPVMNSLINKYLQVMDFFVLFHLDEGFNETIKSRHRDAFNYSSFSEGEKSRIDLALLFTWRQIARMKNSAATNLLILDETFDSSLDNDGVETLMKILDTLETDTNVFVISHKGDMLDGKFRSKIEFVKDHNFSNIK